MGDTTLLSSTLVFHEDCFLRKTDASFCLYPRQVRFCRPFFRSNLKGQKYDKINDC